MYPAADLCAHAAGGATHFGGDGRTDILRRNAADVVLADKRGGKLEIERSTQGYAMRTLAILLISTGLLCPRMSQAQVPLVFQTTFNCPEWIQSNGLGEAQVCNVGDGIAGDGAWVTSNGSQDQITPAANYPGGGGVRGFRHWRGNGSNNNGGGLIITLPAPVTEMWVRLYMRYSLGFGWSGSGPTYTKDNYWGGCGSGCLIFGIQGNHSWGVNFNGATNYPSSLSWAQSQGGNTGDGQWHAYEYHVKQNGAAATIEIWVDDVNYLMLTNANLGNTPWQSFKLGENQGDPAGCNPDCYTDYDDIAISTVGRIGPIGGFVFVPAPRNLRVQ